MPRLPGPARQKLINFLFFQIFNARTAEICSQNERTLSSRPVLTCGKRGPKMSTRIEVRDGTLPKWPNQSGMQFLTKIAPRKTF